MTESKKQKIDMILDWVDRSDYYQILNVPRDANSVTLREAYFALSKKYHPDKFFASADPTSHKKITQVFKRLNEAYTVLKNAKKRKRYDELAFGPNRAQNLRLQSSDDDRGLANPEDNAKTPNGKKYLKLALSAQVKKDWKTVEMNVKFALGFEPDNEFIKNLYEKAQAELEKMPKDDPFKIR